MIIREAKQLRDLERLFMHYAETRPHQVKRLGFDPTGRWAVGPTSEGRVRWLFEYAADLDAFFHHHRGFTLIKGTLRPLVTETRTFQ